MDDHALLRAYLREGSESAFAQLAGGYLPLVHTAALRRMNGDEQRAREVTQLVFSELAQKAAKLAHHPALAAWLHQSTRWHAAKLLRAARRRARHESAAGQHRALVGAPETSPTWESLRPVLDAALDSLRATDRDAVLQRYFMDRPFAAIGRHLGVTENADTIVRKGELDGQYAMLFRQLNLPHRTLDALKTLLVERNQAIYDARQLAQEEGLVFASAAEEKAVANSALGEIDGRIAALIGADGYARLREHVDLAFFRRLAEVARRNSTASLPDPVDDERVRELARRLQQVAPEYEEQVFQSNGWGVDEPPAVRETMAAFVGEVPRPPMAADPRLLRIDRRMQEIARDALLERRISMNQLSGSVAREYKAARERLESASAP